MTTNLQHVLKTYRRNISDDPRRRPLPFCIVRDYGTPAEILVGNWSSWGAAQRYYERHFIKDMNHVYEIFQYTETLELTKVWTK